MVLGIVASDSKKCPPIFIKEGVKVNAQVYQKMLSHNVWLWLKATYPNRNYVFQQNSAPAQKAKTTQTWMKRILANYWPWTIWHPSSSCLNPLDYAIWGIIEAKVWASSHPSASVDTLKAKVKEEWAALTPAYTKKSCFSFRRCLEVA